MKTESQFNQWLRKQISEQSKNKAVIQRVESSTGNGIFDLFVILPHKVLFIESKFQTQKLRSEQAALQIKANSIVENNVCQVMALCAFPKTKRFVVNKYNTTSITEDGITPYTTKTYELNTTGFKKFFDEL